MDPARRRAADAAETEPTPAEDSPLLLLGFARNAVLRVARKREDSNCFRVRHSAAETGHRHRREKAETYYCDDNARPHVSKVTQAKLEELGWDTVPHPPYSPDLAPSDYHLFRPLKAFLARKSFVDFDEVVRAVADFFDSQSPAFWEKGVSELPVRWTTVLANDGDYIID